MGWVSQYWVVLPIGIGGKVLHSSETVVDCKAVYILKRKQQQHTNTCQVTTMNIEERKEKREERERWKRREKPEKRVSLFG